VRVLRSLGDGLICYAQIKSGLVTNNMSEATIPVFRKVGTELQRIPGDHRDPDRRYGMVADAGNQYLVEFTDEEEAQADEDARRWAEDAPKREVEEKRRQQEFEDYKASLVYQKRIVAFLDVLGWADAAERSRNNPELTKNLGVALAMLKGQSDMAAFQRGAGGIGDPQVSQFSDAIAISMLDDPEHGHWVKLSMERTLGWIAARLLDAGLLVRGGVVSDLLIHRENMVYGPALKRAYDLEHATREPRIVLDDELARRWGTPVPVMDQGKVVHVYQEWLKDSDGRYFLDYLQPLGARILPIDPRHLDFELRGAYNAITTAFSGKILRQDVFTKYAWLAQYYNFTLNKYGPCSLPEIQIPAGYLFHTEIAAPKSKAASPIA